MTPGDNGHGGNVWAASAKSGIAMEHLLDFSANINPLGPPRSVRAAVGGCWDEVHRYPDPEYGELRDEIARMHGISGDRVWVGNGASELLYILARCASLRKVVLLAPTFSEYARAVQGQWDDSAVDRVYLAAGEHFRFTGRVQHELLTGIKRNSPDGLFLCRPNSPTGTTLPLEAVEELVRAARRAGAHVVVDESFHPFTFDWTADSAVRLVGETDNLSVVISLTKILSVPGLRVGYVVGRSSFISGVREAGPPWPVSSPAALAARLGLSDHTFLARTCRWLRERRRVFSQKMQSLRGILPFASAANFLLLRLEGPGWGEENPARVTCERLLKRGIMIRDCGGYPGLSPLYIRAAVRRAAENDVLVSALRQMGGEGDDR